MSFITAEQIATPTGRSRYNAIDRIYLPSNRGTRYRVRTLPPPNFYLGDSTTLGALDFSLKSIVKSVKKTAKVILRATPGAVAGFVTGGPVGAVVGAAASYETVRRKTSGLGSGIQVRGLLKGSAYGAGIGAASGLATTAIVGGLTKIAPTTMTTGGLFASSGGTTSGLLTTGLLPSVSSTAFSVGGGIVGAIGSAGKLLIPTLATMSLNKLAVPQISEQSVQETPWVELPASAYQPPSGLYAPIGGGVQPQSPYLTDAYAQSGGAEPTSGYGSPGFAPSEEQIGIIKQAGLFGIPWTYIGLGVTGAMIIYLLSSPKRKTVGR